jgi:hypothetical protein
LSGDQGVLVHRGDSVRRPGIDGARVRAACFAADICGAGFFEGASADRRSAARWALLRGAPTQRPAGTQAEGQGSGLALWRHCNQLGGTLSGA